MHIAAAASVRPPAVAAQWTSVRKAMVRIVAPSDEDIGASLLGTRWWRVRFANGVPVVTVGIPNATALPFPTYLNTSHLGYHGTEPTQALRVANGWLAAYNYGEFGGGLWQFNESGSIAHQLLNEETHGLTTFGHDVLVLQSDNPMSTRKTTVHRFAFRDKSWRQIAETQIDGNIALLQQIDDAIYGILVDWPYAWLIKTTLTGAGTPLAPFSRNFAPRSMARSAHGDFALGGAGYVVWLHRSSSGYGAEWYAPRDCVSYFRPSQDPGNYNARCAGAPGVPAYRRYVRQPLTIISAGTQNGELIDACCPREMLHFQAGKWSSIAPPPPGLTSLYDTGRNVVAVISGTIWSWNGARWNELSASEGACNSPVTSGGDKLWCITRTSARIGVFETGPQGHAETFEPAHGDAAALAPGTHGDVWFSEKDTQFVGHITASRTLEELPVRAPIMSISRGGDAVWFTTDDSYGYIDARDTIHEFKETGALDHVLGIYGAKSGAWFVRTLGQSRVLAYHVKIVNGEAPATSHVAEIRNLVVARDGSVWATTIWPVVVHMTEDGVATQYRLPCVDPHIVLRRAPPNGVWFISKDPHCSGYVDETGIYPDRLPLIEGVEYK